MSQYVTPFVLLNIGSEMIFVVSQRLKAQSISIECSSAVLEDIVSVLISKPMIVELMKPQAAYGHDSIRDVIKNVIQSSSMRLDPVSMEKLWHLITMVFKWQLTMSNDIINLTLRHLYEIETFTTKEDNQLQLQKVQNLVNNFNKILTPKEKYDLRSDVLDWLKDFNVKVSILLRMGLQAPDGTFITSNLSSKAEELLRNLGENIYDVTNNGHLMPIPKPNKEVEISELQLFIDQLSLKKPNKNPILRLAIGEEQQQVFKNINVNTLVHNFNLLEDTTDEKDDSNCLKDKLLAMIGGEDDNA